MSPADAARLRPVPADRPLARFCGYCGRPPADAGTPPTRVCARCGLGLVLAADTDHAPAPDEAFSVIDPGLTVRVLSAAAERLFEVVETDIVGHPVDALLVPAESAPGARSRLHAILAGVARSSLVEAAAETAVVRPARAFGVRYRLRVAPCEPGPAALLVISPL